MNFCENWLQLHLAQKLKKKIENAKQVKCTAIGASLYVVGWAAVPNLSANGYAQLIHHVAEAFLVNTTESSTYIDLTNFHQLALCKPFSD